MAKAIFDEMTFCDVRRLNFYVKCYFFLRRKINNMLRLFCPEKRFRIILSYFINYRYTITYRLRSLVITLGYKIFCLTILLKPGLRMRS